MRPDAARALDARIVGEAGRTVALRHRLHRQPELSRHETKTTAALIEALDGCGLRLRTGPEGLGLIADSGPEGPRVAIRADIDALAVQEATGVAFASEVPGVMHACGHDVHTAVVVAAARALAATAPEVPFRFLFQPAEEATPGGALDFLQAGAMRDVRAVLTLHCDPTRPVGRVGLQAGPISAAADFFEVTLRGRGGHGARPHETQDTVLAVCHAVTGLHQAFDRGLDARRPFVISVGTLHAGRTSANVIPAEATFAGTVRTVDPESRDAVEPIFRRVLEGVATTWGVTTDFRVRRGAPPVVNDANLVAALARAAAGLLGDDAVEPTGLPSMGGEDFAWYLDHAPGALMRLGTGLASPLHSAHFTADDAAIALGARILARAALDLTTP